MVSMWDLNIVVLTNTVFSSTTLQHSSLVFPFTSKYTEGVALRMRRCFAIQRLSRKCKKIRPGRNTNILITSCLRKKIPTIFAFRESLGTRLAHVPGSQARRELGSQDIKKHVIRERDQIRERSACTVVLRHSKKTGFAGESCLQP